MITSVYVRSLDFGFWTAESVTVQKFDGNNDLLWCNHAGATEETEQNQIDRIDEPDIVWESKVMVCDKCPAYRHVGDTEWHDAPLDGVDYETRS